MNYSYHELVILRLHVKIKKMSDGINKILGTVHDALPMVLQWPTNGALDSKLDKATCEYVAKFESLSNEPF
jgi:hypothetical protein